MGKRRKDVQNQELEELGTDTGLCGDIPNKNLSKKRKNKRSQDVNNTENPTNGAGHDKNVSLEVLGDTEFPNLKKKNKKPNNMVDSILPDQEVHVKQKKRKNKSNIQEETKVNSESNDFLVDNASTKKKKKNKKFNPNISESDHVTPLSIENTESCKKNKSCLDSQKETSANTKSEMQIRNKKKKKIADETVEETELNAECHARDYGNTKIKKKKNQVVENQLEIEGNGTNNLNESFDTTYKDKKNKKKKDKIDTELIADKPLKKTKPAMAKFNAEEAAVTEEEIDQFCDELNEEDNKQYEDWVQSIESMLGPRKHDVNKT